MATRCCMPPDSSHGWWSANSGSFTRSSSSRARARRWLAIHAPQLERQLDVLGDACATRTGPPAGRPCRSPGRGGPGGRDLPFTSTRARGRVGEVGDRAAAACSCRTRTGRSATRTRPSPPRGRCRASASTWLGRPRLKTLPTPVDERPPCRHASVSSFGRLRMKARSISATRPATARPSTAGAEHGGVHLGRVGGRLAGVLDDEPADAALACRSRSRPRRCRRWPRPPPASAPARGRAPTTGSRSLTSVVPPAGGVGVHQLDRLGRRRAAGRAAPRRRPGRRRGRRRSPTPTSTVASRGRTATAGRPSRRRAAPARRAARSG